MRTWFFFFLPLREETKHFLATECVWQFHGAPHNMYSDYVGRAIVCRRTLLLLTLFLLAMQLMFSQKLQFLFVFFPAKKQQSVFRALDDIKLKQKILALQRPVCCPQLGVFFLMLRVGLHLLPAHRQCYRLRKWQNMQRIVFLKKCFLFLQKEKYILLRCKFPFIIFINSFTHVSPSTWVWPLPDEAFLCCTPALHQPR